MKELRRTQFGNPILRNSTAQIKPEQITSPNIQQLIANMQYTLSKKKLGVGLAAPQVGKSLALAVIAIQQTKHRPNVKPFDLVIINPEITDYIGNQESLWEGCISAGSSGQADLFAKVPRYKRVKLKYWDETGKLHHRIFSGLKAHVIQHEVDHLNGILFVDRVEDTKTFMTYNEYVKQIKTKKRK